MTSFPTGSGVGRGRPTSVAPGPNGHRSSHNALRPHAGDMRSRRNLDWNAVGQGRREAAPSLAPQEVQYPRIRDVESSMATPYSQRPLDHASGYPINGSSSNAITNPGPTLDFLATPYAGQLLRETPFGQYMPAVQPDVGQGYQSYVPRQSMGAAWNAGSSGFEESLDDIFAGLLHAIDATAPVPASVVNEAQYEPATAGPAFDNNPGSASFIPPALAAQPVPDQGQLILEDFGPLFLTPAENAFALEVDPHLPFDNSGANLGSAVDAVLSKREPFYRSFAGEDPLYWAKSAYQLGLAPPPRQCSVQIGGQSYDFWLPSQEDYASWDMMDVFMLMQRCEALQIEVNWQALNTCGFQVQPLMDSTQTGHGPQPRSAPSGQAQAPTDNFGLLQGFQAPPVPSPQPRAQDPVTRQPPVVQQIQQHSQVPPSDNGAGEVAQPDETPESPSQSQRAMNSSHVAPAAQPQQPQPAPALQQNKARKPRKRKQHDAGAMLQSSDAVKQAADTAIELPTTDDRKQYQRDLEMAWWDPKVDNSAVPESDEDQHAYVKILKEAMIDTSQANDSKEPNTPFTKRWSAAALAKNGYPRTTTEMEATCWDLVEMAVKLHKDGPRFLKFHDQRLQDKLEAEQDLTFQQRIDTMATVMLLSKARVDKLLKHENLGSFVGHPMDILKSTKGNRLHNDKRKDQNQRGKQAQREDEERAAAAAAAPGTDAATSTVKENAETREGEEEEEEEVGVEEVGEGEKEDNPEDEDEEPQEFAKGDGSDDDDDDEDDSGGDGMAVQNSVAATSNEEGREDAGPSDSHDDADNGPGTSQRQSSNARSNRASSSRPLIQRGTRTPSNTTPRDGQRASSRPSAGAFARQSRPPPRRNASQNAPLAPSGSSLKRPATIHHGLSLPSSPKRSRSASYTGSDDEVIYHEPRASPGQSSPGKRRSSDAELEDTNTRHKSARTADRQIIAPRRTRRSPQ